MTTSPTWFLRSGKLISVKTVILPIDRCSHFVSRNRYSMTTAKRVPTMRRDRNQLRNVILAGVCTPRINGVTCRLPETWFAAAFVVKSIRISFADDDEIFLAVDLRSGKDRGSLGRITGSHRLHVVG